jgi:hypothetical protein
MASLGRRHATGRRRLTCSSDDALDHTLKLRDRRTGAAPKGPDSVVGGGSGINDRATPSSCRHAESPIPPARRLVRRPAAARPARSPSQYVATAAPSPEPPPRARRRRLARNHRVRNRAPVDGFVKFKLTAPGKTALQRQLAVWTLPRRVSAQRARNPAAAASSPGSSPPRKASPALRPTAALIWPAIKPDHDRADRRPHRRASTTARCAIASSTIAAGTPATDVTHAHYWRWGHTMSPAGASKWFRGLPARKTPSNGGMLPARTVDETAGTRRRAGSVSAVETCSSAARPGATRSSASPGRTALPRTALPRTALPRAGLPRAGLPRAGLSRASARQGRARRWKRRSQ